GVKTGGYSSRGAIIWSNDKWTVVSNAIYSSQYGSDWTFVANPNTSALTAIVNSGSQYVTVGGNGEIFTSPDGISWTSRTSGTVEFLYDVVYSGQFIAVGSGGTILTSPDGITWTSRTSGTANSL